MTKKQLRDYCEAEFENIEFIVSQLFTVVKPEKKEYSISELAAIATFTHNFYNGCENILKRVSSFQRIEIKDAPTWHKDLLKTSQDIGIISPDLGRALAGYLSFRHFFIHAYSFSLKWEDLNTLVESLEETLENFKKEVLFYINSVI